MMKHAKLIVLSCAAALFSAPALADHCSGDLAAVQQRLSQPTSATANALEAAAGLVQDGIMTCQSEVAVIAASPLDDPMRQPDYITVGRSMLVNAYQLVNGE